MLPAKITHEHLQRAAYVYVRQSTLTQLAENHESRRLQYEQADRARTLGWARVEVVDEDLGRSGSGRVSRPGFERLISAVCVEEVGAVFAIEASRLARNNRDWHHLIDLCGLTATLIIDGAGIYDPCQFDDRLLLGLKGTMSEWELGVLRQRSMAALKAKAERGELLTTVPVGFLRSRDDRCELDPDRRIREAIQLVFAQFQRLGSIRQVLLWFRSEKVELPAVEYGSFGRSVVWKLPTYTTLHHILTNPMYAGAYAHGRTTTKISVKEGSARKRSGLTVPQENWTVLIPEHHDGYISWADYQANQGQIAENARIKGLVTRGPVDRGAALLAGLLRCRRCGRRLHVAYSGATGRVPRYGCRGAAINHGTGTCISIGGLRIDRAIEEAVLAIIQPGSIDAALQAAEEGDLARQQRKQLVELKLQQARYEADLARRQYHAVDPENRLVAAELERRWNAALQVVVEIEAEVAAIDSEQRRLPAAERTALMNLAEDLPKVWHHKSADMRLKKQIVRILIEEVLVDVNESASEVLLVIRWAGGQHTRMAIPKQRKGQHRFTTDRTVVEIVRELAKISRDGQIANVLNRLGLKTGRGNTWNASRVTTLRCYQKIPVFDPIDPDLLGVLTLEQAANALGISVTATRRLLSDGVLRGRQVVPHAPWTIKKEDLKEAAVQNAVERVRNGRKRPRREMDQQLNLNP